MDKEYLQWCRIADSITWLYLKGIISFEEKDRLYKESSAYFHGKVKA